MAPMAEFSAQDEAFVELSRLGAASCSADQFPDAGVLELLALIVAPAVSREALDQALSFWGVALPYAELAELDAEPNPKSPALALALHESGAMAGAPARLPAAFASRDRCLAEN